MLHFQPKRLSEFSVSYFNFSLPLILPFATFLSSIVQTPLSAHNRLPSEPSHSNERLRGKSSWHAALSVRKEKGGSP